MTDFTTTTDIALATAEAITALGGVAADDPMAVELAGCLVVIDRGLAGGLVLPNPALLLDALRACDAAMGGEVVAALPARPGGLRARITAPSAAAARGTGRLSISERLIVRLRTLGLDLPPGTRLVRVNPSRAMRSEGGWSWTAAGPDGIPLTLPSATGPSRAVGSQYSMQLLLRQPDLAITEGHGADLEIDPPPSYFPVTAQAGATGHRGAR